MKFKAPMEYERHEKRIFCQAQSIRVRNESATQIINNLCFHYHVKCPSITFEGWKSGCANHSYIKLPNVPSLRITLHELAHYMHQGGYFNEELGGTELKETGSWHHGLHFQLVLRKLHNYCEQYNYFI